MDCATFIKHFFGLKCSLGDMIKNIRRGVGGWESVLFCDLKCGDVVLFVPKLDAAVFHISLYLSTDDGSPLFFAPLHVGAGTISVCSFEFINAVFHVNHMVCARYVS